MLFHSGLAVSFSCDEKKSSAPVRPRAAVSSPCRRRRPKRMRRTADVDPALKEIDDGHPPARDVAARGGRVVGGHVQRKLGGEETP